MFTMSRSSLQKYCEQFANRKIGVLGDFALDCYWTIESSAALPSIETGKPTKPVSEQHYAPGAAGNVVANLMALGCAQVRAFGVIGKDPWGTELKRTLQDRAVDTSGIMQQEQNWATTAYVKPLINGVEQNRFDFGDFNELHEQTAIRLISALEQSLPDLDAIIINAQARASIHTPMLRRALQTLIQQHPQKIFVVDSREPHTMYAGAILKINNHELATVSDANITTDTVCDALKRLYAQRKQTVFVTCGPEGIVVCDANGCTRIDGISDDGPLDTTGGGDAAIAGITAALSVKAQSAEAAFMGNLAAAVCVRKLQQTGTASPREMLALHAGSR